MTNSEVVLNCKYIAKVSGKLVEVVILHKLSIGKGWCARNCETGRKVHIRSARRLRGKLT